jgi:DNA processing protein
MNMQTASFASMASRYTAPLHASVLSHASCGTLHVAGEVSLLGEPCVAIVGSRKASRGSLDVAAELATALVAKGVVVVSGLAAGIDSVSQNAAIRAGGRTVGVIGTPLDRAYPSSSATLQERVHREHLLVSPFAEGVTTAPWHFPVRDRVIARLALATVLVEADEKSGTRYVVEECIRQGKVVFARSGLLERLTWLRRASARSEVAQWDEPNEVVGRLCARA